MASRLIVDQNIVGSIPITGAISSSSDLVTLAACKAVALAGLGVQIPHSRPKTLRFSVYRTLREYK